MSAPNSAGVFNLVKDNKSAITIAFPPFLWIWLIASLGSIISPKVPGYGRTPHISFSFILLRKSFGFPINNFNPKGSVLVFIRSIVCGLQSLETKTCTELFLSTR